MGAEKQQPLVPRLTTGQDMPCTGGPSIQDGHTTTQAGYLPSLVSTHRWFPLHTAPKAWASRGLKPTRGLMGLGPSWVFTAHREQGDRQSAAVEGSVRTQAASISLCHAILLGSSCWEGERENNKNCDHLTVHPEPGSPQGKQSGSHCTDEIRGQKRHSGCPRPRVKEGINLC